MEILKHIISVRDGKLDFAGKAEEAVFIFGGVLGNTLVRQFNFAGKAVKVLAAFSEQPVQSNFYEVFDQEKMSNLIPRLAVKTAILCVPHKNASHLAGQLAKCGIRRILNWSGEILSAGPQTVVFNEEPPCTGQNN